MNNRIANIFSIVLCVGLIAACGSTNPPTQQLAETRMVIQQADQVGANEYAPLELREARRKLDLANEAMEKQDYERAIRLAEHARVDAELAHIKTLSGRSLKAVTELRESIRILQEELDRNSNIE